MSNFECLCKKCGKTSLLSDYNPFDQLYSNPPSRKGKVQITFGRRTSETEQPESFLFFECLHCPVEEENAET